ncbi:MAG: hypothetical protein DHS20C17_30290 [Cyclobacteriaceae bacterium]|nr:MAG: hypothetical protein DHS20C17_30290 [Cyclobacteriaceae bacterium]
MKLEIKRNILLNPGPATTSDAVKRALVVPDICPREKEFGDLLAGICTDLPAIVHGDSEYLSVLFTASGTGGLEAAVTSAIPKNGKLMVIENGAYGKRIQNIAQTYKIPTTSYSLEYGSYPDLSEVERMLKQDPEISHLAVVHHETTTGMLNPVGEICQLAHRYNVEVIIDAMSSFAGIPINIRDWNAEYLISSSNKCIQGMPGLVFVIFRKDLLAGLKENQRSFYFDMFTQFTGFHKTGQMPYTPPVQIVYSLRKAIDEYFSETEIGRWDRYRTNWETLYSGLLKLGFKFLLPLEQQSKILLAVLDPVDSKFSFQEMHDYLYQRGFTIYPGKGASKKTFRLAIIGDLYQEDIENFLVTLKEYIDLNDLKISD